MTIIDDWAKDHSIPPHIIADLRKRMGVERRGLEVVRGSGSEAGAQSAVRAEASRAGCRLWRNNIGAGYMQDGSFLRWGLANDTAQMNKAVKSADLIGIRPVLITSAHIGCTIGQFLSREIKAPGWRYRGTDREEAQLVWAELIISFGGDAAFATGEGTI